MDMGRVMRERHWSNNYQYLFINWKAKEIEHSIFIKASKDFANVLSNTGKSEKYVDHLITSCKYPPCKTKRIQWAEISHIPVTFVMPLFLFIFPIKLILQLT